MAAENLQSHCVMQAGAGRRGGFPPSIFSNQTKSESYHCLICFEVCRSPVTCQSGAHLFCLNCLAASLRRNASCPVCREPLTAPLPSAFASAQVSALDVVCVHDKCKWKGTCARLDGHLDIECTYEPIACSEEACRALVPRGEMATHQQFACLQSCPNSKPNAEGSDKDEQDTCDVRLSRNDLIDHLKYHCKLRPTHCPHPSCEVSTMYNRMSAHLEICPYAPVACPIQCGAPNLTRQSLDAHKRDCPNEPVPCVHAPLGCSHVAPRDQIAEHEQDNGVHFVALSKAFVQLQQSHEQQQQSHHQLHQMFEEKLQVQMSLLEKLQAQAAIFEEDLHILQPVVASAKTDAKAIADAEGMADDVIGTLRCYFCTSNNPAVSFYRKDNASEPLRKDRKDSNCIYGFFGTCSKHRMLGIFTWGLSIGSSKDELVEIILRKLKSTP